MSGFKTLLCLGFAALTFSANAFAVPPQALQNVAERPWIELPLSDANGNVRVIMRIYGGEAGQRQISFLDPNYQVINTVTEPAPPAAATSENALRGDPVPDVLAPDDDKGDVGDDIQALKVQVKALKAQVRLLAERINEAAAK